MTPPRRSRRRTTRTSGPTPVPVHAAQIVVSGNVIAGATLGLIPPTSHTPLVYNQSTSYITGFGSPSDQSVPTSEQSTSSPAGSGSPDIMSPLLPTVHSSYTALTSQAIEQHNLYQASPPAYPQNEPLVTVYSTNLPSYTHPTSTQTQLYMSPMEFFEIPSTLAHQQHSDYLPLPAEPTVLHNLEASSHTQHCPSNTPSLQVNPSISGSENYPSPRIGAHYFSDASFSPSKQ